MVRSTDPKTADEITRLYAENERLKLDCASYEATMRAIAESSDGAELARLNALVDEMREGLERVVSAPPVVEAYALRVDGCDCPVCHAHALIAKAQPPVSHD
jgi:hypothetical protein